MTGNILVTGGAGYVGSHACLALARRGFTPVTYDNLERGHDWAIRFGPFERGHIGNRARLDEVLAKHRPAAILHFAAFAYVGESVENPALYHQNNVIGSRVLLEACMAAGIGAFVFSSTCAVYGEPERMPLVEGMPERPINPYGETKLAVERLLREFRPDGGPAYAALRYFNAAGAAPDSGIGEAHAPETHLIPLVLEAAAGRRSAITVLGTDYPTPDGTCIRDYIHVLDLADAHIAALTHLLDGGGDLTLNLGTGTGYSVHEVIETAKAVTGCDIDVKTAERRAGDPPRLIADARLARDTLGWTPSRTLEVQIADAWRWHRMHWKD